MPSGQAQVRGEHVLEATVRVIAEHGVAGLSMRRVAADSEVSLAQVQYYFRTKDDLIAAAFGFVGDEFLAALQTALPADTSWRRLHAAIWLWLPLDTERERAARVWFAFTTAAAVSPRLAALSADLDGQLRSWFTQELENLQTAGQLAASVAVRPAAAQILALIDGATLQGLTMPVEARHDHFADTIDHYLDALVRHE